MPWKHRSQTSHFIRGNLQTYHNNCRFLYTSRLKCVYSVVSDSSRPLWTAGHQGPLCMEFSQQEFWNGLPFPTPGDLSDPEINLFYFIIFNILIFFLSSDPHNNTESWKGRDYYLLCVHVSVYVCVCVCVCVCMLSLFSRVQLFATPWSVALQTPLSIGFFRQEYWSRLSCPPPGDLPDPGIEPMSLMPPALAGGFFTTSTTWEALAPRKLRLHKL